MDMLPNPGLALVCYAICHMLNIPVYHNCVNRIYKHKKNYKIDLHSLGSISLKHNTVCNKCVYSDNSNY